MHLLKRLERAGTRLIGMMDTLPRSPDSSKEPKVTAWEGVWDDPKHGSSEETSMDAEEVPDEGSGC